MHLGPCVDIVEHQRTRCPSAVELCCGCLCPSAQSVELCSSSQGPPLACGANPRLLCWKAYAQVFLGFQGVVVSAGVSPMENQQHFGLIRLPIQCEPHLRKVSMNRDCIKVASFCDEKRSCSGSRLRAYVLILLFRVQADVVRVWVSRHVRGKERRRNRTRKVHMFGRTHVSLRSRNHRRIYGKSQRARRVRNMGMCKGGTVHTLRVLHVVLAAKRWLLLLFFHFC